MTVEEFEKSLEEMQVETVETLRKKAKEYASDSDRLHNFKVAAALQGVSDVEALCGMMAKHIVSVYDMAPGGKLHPRELWMEKIKDSINYLYLLWAVLNEIE